MSVSAFVTPGCIFNSDFYFYLLIFILLIIIIAMTSFMNNFANLAIGITLFVLLVISSLFFAYGLSIIGQGCELTRVALFLLALTLILTGISALCQTNTGGNTTTLIFLLLTFISLILFIVETQNYYAGIYLVWIILFYIASATV